VTTPPNCFDQQLRFAIAHKHLIEVCYRGTLRVAEPHDYGIYKGIERLFIYQLRGAMPSLHGVAGWRLLDTSQIEECLVLEKKFPGSRGQHYHRTHLVWDIVYARVS
jgi:hypothetical protein